MAFMNADGGRTFHFNFSLSESLLSSLKGAEGSDEITGGTSAETEILLMSKCLSVTFGSLLCRTTTPQQSPVPGLDPSTMYTNGTSDMDPVQNYFENPVGVPGANHEEPLDLSVPCSDFDHNGIDHNMAMQFANSEVVVPRDNHVTGKKRSLSLVSSRGARGGNSGFSGSRKGDAKALKQEALETAAAIAWNRIPHVAADFSTEAPPEVSDESNQEPSLDSEIIHKTTSLVSNDYFALVSGTATNGAKIAKSEDMSSYTTSSGDKRQFRLSEWERTNFRCSICGKMFKHLTNVSRHKRMIHNANFDSPAVCPEATEDPNTKQQAISREDHNSAENTNVKLSDDYQAESSAKETIPKVQEHEFEKQKETKEKPTHGFSVEDLTGNDNKKGKITEADQKTVQESLITKKVIEQLVQNNNQLTQANSAIAQPDTQMANLASIICSSSAVVPVLNAPIDLGELKQGQTVPPLLEGFQNEASSLVFQQEPLNFDPQNSTKALLNLIMDINKSSISSAISMQSGQTMLTDVVQGQHQQQQQHGMQSCSPDSSGSGGSASGMSKNAQRAAQRRLKKPVPKNTFQYSKVRLPFPIEISPEERNSLACNVCKYQFTILSNLRRHKKVYGHYEKHICSRCNEIFTSSERFNNHSAKCTGTPSKSSLDSLDSMHNSDESMKSDFDSAQLDEDNYSDEMDGEPSPEDMDYMHSNRDCITPIENCVTSSESCVTTCETKIESSEISTTLTSSASQHSASNHNAEQNSVEQTIPQTSDSKQKHDNFAAMHQQNMAMLKCELQN